MPAALDCGAMPTFSMTRGRTAGALAALFVVALAWRGVMAVLMPCLSRDGVTFCWYARALEQRGIAYLRQPTTQQHPAYPALILAVRRLALACGASDGPLLWQASGQSVAFAAGLLVIGLSAALAARIAAAAAPRVDSRLAACMAAGLAAVLPLNIELSVDVLSDSLHLAFYLAAALCITSIRRPPSAAACGLASGLAFATRPEGAGVLLGGAAACFAAAWIARRGVSPVNRGVRRAALSGVLLVAGFAAVAGPFAWVMGRFTPKKDPADVLGAAVLGPLEAAADRLVQRAAGAPAADGPATARLITFDLSWYQIPGFIAYMTLRAGRVVVPLLGAAGVALAWRHRRRPESVGLATCFVLHAGLLCLLLHRWRYLAPRHTLVLVALLLPFAGLALARGWALAGDWLTAPHGRTPAGKSGTLLNRAALLRVGGLALAAAPLIAYALRVPNGGEASLRRAANWLIENDRTAREKLLTGDNSAKRIAFYADMGWDGWLEDPGDWPRIRDTTLTRKPDYFALDSGHDGEAALIDRLLDDAEIGPRMAAVFQVDSGRGGRLQLFALTWSTPPAGGT